MGKKAHFCLVSNKGFNKKVIAWLGNNAKILAEDAN
jgi:hypothetical protein